MAEEKVSVNSSEWQVIVTRSKKRKRTMEARAEKAEKILYLKVPFEIDQKTLDKFVQSCLIKFGQEKDNSLENRAKELSLRYFGKELKFSSIKYTDRYKKKWGSCRTQTKEILINVLLKGYPDWVLDFVIVHELAHLLIADHGKEFKKLVNKYPKAERAIGFLIAKGYDEENIEP